MAAAEYYTPGGQQPTGPQPGLAPPSHGNLNPPYPLSDAPPPYSQFDQRPHSQPPPQHRPSAPGEQYYPPPPSNGYPAYPPHKSGRPPQNMHKPPGTPGPYPPQPYPQQAQYLQAQPQGYFGLAGTPAMQQVYANGNADGRKPSSTPAYGPPRSPYRDDSQSRSRSRGAHHSHHHHKPEVKRKHSSGVHSFLGAGGGAIIGDAIFPGLGTLGGAILGGLGGHEYGRQRRSYSNPGRIKGQTHSNEYEHYENDHRRGRRA
ncbi:Hypothetical predicted protein [Lecanosticta acicola]|uniref:Uncharacterized protein n=1 Tax=Lecanosticta acicola TaxID=111012 RepID=A0AAI9E8J6_9PEZI|nr:Hypothetical predicted protein [Lecanosticta acicola]